MSNQPQNMSSSDHERGVVVRSVGDNALGDVRDGFVADGDGEMAPKPLEFTVKDYRSFRAEYALKDRDLVIHFFLPTNITEREAYQYRDWWLNEFPQLLDREAQEYFKAGPPRLMARYTEEMASWWFKAQGYDHLLDPLAYLDKFLLVLDGACLELV